MSQLPRLSLADVPAVTAAQMREIDRLATDHFGITLPQMMELAGSGLARVATERLGDVRGARVVVLVGPGNNGGGGLVAARHLINRGAVVHVFLATPVRRLPTDSRERVATLIEMGVPVCVAEWDLPDGELDEMLAGSALLLDALLGYAAEGPPRGSVRDLVERAAASGTAVLSLDLPTGLDPDIEAIGHATTMTFCTPGQLLLSPDDPPDRIHIVKKGRVRVYRLTPEGKQLTLDIYDRGTILGDMRMLGQNRLPEAYVEAVEEGVICTISPQELRRLIERYPAIGVNVISHLATRLQEAERELEAMAYQNVGQRLARKLIDLSQRFGVESVRGTLIQARLTQQELADMIGTTRETLAHTIGEFRRRGLVTTDQQRVVIKDAERLLDVAEGTSD